MNIQKTIRMKKYFLLLGIACMTFVGFAQKENDTTAIKKVLEKEAATWRSGDFEGHRACWHIQPYSKILISTSEGKTIDVPAALMVSPTTKMGDGGFAEQSNIKVSITGTSAWVSHDEVSTDKNGVKTYSYEIRMLEKIKGQWKLVGQSIHAYKQ